MLALAALGLHGGALAAIFEVDDFGDGADANPNDSLCETQGGSCTLRAAIQQANASPGRDDIVFESVGSVTLSLGVVDISDDLTIQLDDASAVTLTSSIGTRMLRILGAGTVVLLEGLTFSNPNGPGVIVGAGPLVTIRNCLFEGNVNSGGSQVGAALSVGGETIVEDSTFRNNSSVITSGGAIALNTNAQLTISDTLIEHNTANNGGGIVVSGGSRLVLQDVVLQNNTALRDGGGIYSDSRVELERVTLFQNKATKDGGAVWANNLGGGNSVDALDLEAVLIRDNEAEGRGGGVYVGSMVGLHDVEITRSTFWENTADEGGGIYIAAGFDSKVNLANVTIGGNTANTGGGVFLRSGDLQLVHATIWDNQSEQLRNSDSVRGQLGNSIIGTGDASGSGCSFPPIVVGPNLGSETSCGVSLIGDPRLDQMTLTGGYAPTQPFRSGSPAENAAATDLCSADPVLFFDADGPGRPNGSRCDLGAWESDFVVVSADFEDD